MKKIKIKICGQTNPAIIEHCLNIGVDQQGLIFYEKSPRNLEYGTLQIINQYFQSYKNKFVGVFVNPTLKEIEEKLNVFDFNTIQLHGSENQSTINEIYHHFKKDIYKSISPINFQNTTLKNVVKFLIEGEPSKNDQPGGNNKTWNWNDFKNSQDLPFILSGGLNQDNLSQAINLTGANFVDINSGVEKIQGEKDLSLIDSLISSLKNE
ncbi:phosphoribosylanthranilate isomerase [Alphaproteobacteria bacterium]|jgi:phosphoribosylanthranilate isomerase|nr:phosphoribosylanthranilate isomerase [Alphaproteobacteria bacterium]